MKKKLISFIVSFSMLAALPVPAFAGNIDATDNNNETTVEELNVDETADFIEEMVGDEDVINDLDENSDEFVEEGEGGQVSIPKDSDDTLTLADNEVELNIGMPKEVNLEEGELTDQGTVVYDGSDENVSVSVQALEEAQGDLNILATRQLITIEDANAPKTYSFDYDLQSGCRLIRSEEYASEYNQKLKTVHSLLLQTRRQLKNQPTKK